MRILHLSDIHFGRHYEQYHEHGVFENRQLILSEMLSVLEKMDTKIDHIIMTGDIAWHGEKQEFQEALVWFQDLLNVTDLTPDCITFCPGNHDVNRKYTNYELGSNHIESDKTFDYYANIPVDQLDECYRYDHIYLYETPLENYNWFCSQLGVTPFLFPVKDEFCSSYSIGFKDIWGVSGDKVRIVSFNTALFSSLKAFPDDKNIIGLPQILDLLKYGIIGNDDKLYTIAIFHHAERYLHPDEISEYNSRKPSLPFLRGNVDLILCGHTETGGKPVLYHQDNGAYTLTAGAAYYDDNHPNAFSIIDINTASLKPQVFPYINNIVSWSPFNDEPKVEIIKTIKRIPKVGEMKGPGKYKLISGEKIFEHPIRKLEVFSQDGICGTVNNFGDPCRLLDISATGFLKTPGHVEYNIQLAPSKTFSVEAMLEREQLFSFMKAGYESEEGIRLEITNQNETIVQEDIITDANLEDVDENSITLLKMLRQIEDYYDVRIKRPDDLYESDKEAMDIMLGLMEKGYHIFPEKYTLNKASTMIDSKEQLIALYQSGSRKNKFYLGCEDNYTYTVCKKPINLYHHYIIAGPFAVDLKDLRRKAKTFLSGDNRKLSFYNNSDTRVILLSDRDNLKKIPEFSNLSGSSIIEIGNMKIDFDFIKEEHKSQDETAS